MAGWIIGGALFGMVLGGVLWWRAGRRDRINVDTRERRQMAIRDGW